MENPKIRFKGFTKDWEQRKFSELYARSSEKNDGSIGMDKNITVATMQFKNDVKVSTTEYLKTYYTFKLGDIAFEGHQSKEFRYGRFVENDIGNGIVSHIFAVFRPIQEYDLYFWKYAINNETLMQRILARSTKASTMMHDLVTNDFLNETFLVPSVKEQKQIGAFLNKLDNLITLHQRKCEQTKNLKKYMLQKMFPQNGAKVPEIRFNGFTHDWEQRKLGDVFKEYSEKNHTELSALTIIQGGGTVKREDSDRNLMYDTSNLSNYKMVRKDDFIVHLRSFEGGLEKSSLDGIISPAYHTFHSDMADSRFYYPYFRSYEFIKHKLVSHVYGIRDGRSIDIDGMKTIEIPYTSIEEQRKIGDYLDCLDHLITLHQRQCDELKKMKKYMLQNMFI